MTLQTINDFVRLHFRFSVTLPFIIIQDLLTIVVDIGILFDNKF